jgi:hypothetical protein
METCPALARGTNFAENANTLRWQYNGVVPFDDIIDWCREHFTRVHWSYLNETIFFANEKDYTFFLLRWA